MIVRHTGTDTCVVAVKLLLYDGVIDIYYLYQSNNEFLLSQYPMLILKESLVNLSLKKRIERAYRLFLINERDRIVDTRNPLVKRVLRVDAYRLNKLDKIGYYAEQVVEGGQLRINIRRIIKKNEL